MSSKQVFYALPRQDIVHVYGVGTLPAGGLLVLEEGDKKLEIIGLNPVRAAAHYTSKDFDDWITNLRSEGYRIIITDVVI